MPIYDYFCEECDKLFEAFHQGVNSIPEECPECGQDADKVFTTDGIHLRRPRYVPPPLATRKFGDTRRTPHKRQRW